MSEEQQLTGSQFDKVQANKGSTVGGNICGILCLLAFVIATFVVLAEDDSDCEKPVRLWLFVNAIAYIVSIVIQIIFTLAVAFWWQSVVKITSGFFILLSLFNVVWFILGNVWLYGSDNCQDDFESGYTLALVILIISYVVLGFALCGCCCLCIGGLAALKSS